MVMKMIAGLQAEMDKSMHTDDVYDIDTNCLADKKKIISLMLHYYLCYVVK